MKKALSIVLLLCMAGALRAEKPDYLEEVSRKWLNQEKHEIRRIGYARIAANTNDIAGHIILLSYDVGKADIPNVLDRLARIRTLGESFTGSNFRAEFPAVKALQDLFMESPDAAERRKTAITNKTLVLNTLLTALEKDGYFRADDEAELEHLKTLRGMLEFQGTVITNPDRSDPNNIAQYAEKNNIAPEKVSRIALEIAKEQKAQVESRGGNTLWYKRSMGYLIWKPHPIYLPFLEEANFSTNRCVRGKALLGYIAAKKADSVEFAEARLAAGLYDVHDQRDAYREMGRQIQNCDENGKKKIIRFLLRQSRSVEHFYPMDMLDQLLQQNIPGYQYSVQRKRFACRQLDSPDTIAQTVAMRMMNDIYNVPASELKDLSDWTNEDAADRAHPEYWSTNLIRHVADRTCLREKRQFYEKEFESYPPERVIPVLERLVDGSNDADCKLHAFELLIKTETKTGSSACSLRTARKIFPVVSDNGGELQLKCAIIRFLADHGDDSDLPLLKSNATGPASMVRTCAQTALKKKCMWPPDEELWGDLRIPERLKQLERRIERYAGVSSWEKFDAENPSVFLDYAVEKKITQSELHDAVVRYADRIHRKLYDPGDGKSWRENKRRFCRIVDFMADTGDKSWVPFLEKKHAVSDKSIRGKILLSLIRLMGADSIALAEKTLAAETVIECNQQLIYRNMADQAGKSNGDERIKIREFLLRQMDKSENAETQRQLDSLLARNFTEYRFGFRHMKYVYRDLKSACASNRDHWRQILHIRSDAFVKWRKDSSSSKASELGGTQTNAVPVTGSVRNGANTATNPPVPPSPESMKR